MRPTSPGLGGLRAGSDPDPTRATDGLRLTARELHT